MHLSSGSLRVRSRKEPFRFLVQFMLLEWFSGLDYETLEQVEFTLLTGTVMPHP